MGDLRLGGWVYDENGQPCRVTRATEIMTGHDCFLVVFEGNARIVADADHQWLVRSLADPNPRVLTTRQILHTPHDTYFIPYAEGKGWRRLFYMRPVPSVPVRCIEVDSPSRLYLAGRDYIVTHNTSFGPWWLWREIEQQGPGDYIAATSTFDLFKLKLLPELRKVFEDILGIGRYWAGDKVIEVCDLETGEFRAKNASDPMWARIILRSAASPGSLESATAKAAWLDEVGQEGFSLQAWEAILRRLSLHEGRVLGTTTLYTIGWLKQQVYEPWRKGDPDFDVIQFASTLNPIFSKAEFERARRTLPEWKFNMFYLGQFSRPPGLIYGDYKDYEAGGHLRKRFPIPSHWPRYVGMDPGAVHLATVWIAHDQQRNIFYAYRESLEGEMTTREHVAKAQERATGENVVLWAGGAASEVQVRKDWSDAGQHVMKPIVPDVEAGIDRVIELFKTYRLFVFEDLNGLRDELTTYSRVLDKTTLEPTEEIKDKNKFHYADALRYIAQMLPAVGDGDLDLQAGQGANPWAFIQPPTAQLPFTVTNAPTAPPPPTDPLQW